MRGREKNADAEGTGRTRGSLLVTPGLEFRLETPLTRHQAFRPVVSNAKPGFILAS